ncbi:MAG: Uma2 family endonuclease [Candidatus Sumerlaeia bacterium]|nr:Uma2 family endonuclease [Candidatus Sumerlaeia bacterium]
MQQDTTDSPAVPGMNLRWFSPADHQRMREHGIAPDSHWRGGAILDSGGDEHRFTVDEYLGLVEAEVLLARDPVELIEGRIVEVSPSSDGHTFLVSVLTRIFNRNLDPDHFAVVAQLPCLVEGDSMPEPDLGVYRGSLEEIGGNPPVSRALLLVEVMVTSHEKDRHAKLPLYARSGVPEVWLVDVLGRRLHAYRQPVAGESRYALEVVLGPEDTAKPERLPEVELPLAGLLRAIE